MLHRKQIDNTKTYNTKIFQGICIILKTNIIKIALIICNCNLMETKKITETRNNQIQQNVIRKQTKKVLNHQGKMRKSTLMKENKV